MHKLAPVLVTGLTGTGKSSSVGEVIDEDTGKVISLGLPPEKTIVVNPEQQPLPILNFGEFKNIYIDTYKKNIDVLNAILKIKSSKIEDIKEKLENELIDGVTVKDVWNAKYMVYDSLTSMSEIIERYCNSVFSGWDAWKEYNLKIAQLLNIFKKIQMQVFVMGIPEVNEKSIDNKLYFKVKGKELKYGAIEKEFVVVLFTNPIYKDNGEVDRIEFQFKSNRANTAKAPMRMFERGIPNDLFLVAQSIKKFYKIELDNDNRRSKDEQEYVKKLKT